MRITCFTGAGVSQESGLRTFRGEDGLWNGVPIEEVCTAGAWRRQPAVVLDFYNLIRREVARAEPNAAHRVIAGLELGHEVTVVTQNVDDLHERAGSTRVLHMHGLITRKRTDADPDALLACEGDIALGDVDASGNQFRPHVVFFEEPIYHLEEAYEACVDTDLLLVVGTSLAVMPGAAMVMNTVARIVLVVDPAEIDLSALALAGRQVVHIRKPATAGLAEVAEMLGATPLTS